MGGPISLWVVIQWKKQWWITLEPHTCPQPRICTTHTFPPRHKRHIVILGMQGATHTHAELWAAGMNTLHALCLHGFSHKSRSRYLTQLQKQQPAHAETKPKPQSLHTAPVSGRMGRSKHRHSSHQAGAYFSTLPATSRNLLSLHSACLLSSLWEPGAY